MNIDLYKSNILQPHQLHLSNQSYVRINSGEKICDNYNFYLYRNLQFIWLYFCSCKNLCMCVYICLRCCEPQIFSYKILWNELRVGSIKIPAKSQFWIFLTYLAKIFSSRSKFDKNCFPCCKKKLKMYLYYYNKNNTTLIINYYLNQWYNIDRCYSVVKVYRKYRHYL